MLNYGVRKQKEKNENEMNLDTNGDRNNWKCRTVSI